MLERNRGTTGTMFWGRKDEEYIADFLLVTKRSLSEKEMKLFRYHFLLGADWRLCVRKLHMEKGDFFHELYRIEERLDRVYRELKPYALYPLDEYFSAASRGHIEACVIPPNVVSLPDSDGANDDVDELIDRRKAA